MTVQTITEATGRIAVMGYLLAFLRESLPVASMRRHGRLHHLAPIQRFCLTPAIQLYQIALFEDSPVDLGQKFGKASRVACARANTLARVEAIR